MSNHSLPSCSPMDLLAQSAQPKEPEPISVKHVLTPDQCEELYDEQMAMRVAQRTRMLVVAHYTKGGKSVPVDPAEVRVLLSAADGIDRQSLGRLRAKTDQQLGDAAVSAAAMAEELLKDRDALIARFRTGETPTELIAAAKLPTDFIPVAGQMEINPVQENFEAFRTRMNMD